MTLPDTMTLGAARSWLRDRVDQGETCPCCTQLAKTYRRRLHSAMARDLIYAHRAAGHEIFHVRTVFGHDGGDFAKLAYWGLIAEEPHRREDGGRAGYWHITQEGAAFVHSETSVMSHARVYNGRCLGFTGEPITIRDALGRRFDYAELMA